MLKSVKVRVLSVLHMEYKNRTFKLFGETWKIVYKKGISLPGDTETVGMHHFGITSGAEHTIYVNLLNSRGKPATKETIESTLRHELVHAIFGSGQYLSCSDDEPLVEWTGKCIGELIRQNVFP